MSRIAGKTRARPETVVKLATALGISARRMRTICDAASEPKRDDQEAEQAAGAA